MTPAQREELRARIIEAATDEQFLELRIRRILGKMALLAEGATSKPEKGKPKKPKATSRSPECDRQGLYYTYSKAFETLTGYRARSLKCYAAERDYRLYTHATTPEDTHSRNVRILKDYQGIPSLEAAVLEGVSDTHMRRLRFQGGYDPASGEPLERVRAA